MDMLRVSFLHALGREAAARRNDSRERTCGEWNRMMMAAVDRWERYCMICSPFEALGNGFLLR